MLVLISAHVAAQAPLAQFTKAFGPHHILLLRLRDALLRAAIAAQQWELALQTACDMLPTYQLIYTQVCNRRDTSCMVTPLLLCQAPLAP